ncbi:hypothetical protein CS006_06615 [Bifidobacterium primatium]|uniref:DUF2316 domain-containing protein n=1 Tax=Bifidobacterium primatium TaxID=2045438 RepID=A0A2M9H805_9BIFI|nr:DUF2316 family protein [Bifidobacterium primatium]PJM72927.1 hypothetical protein CS006_06615 [Bifidobacterium primatium]
MSLSMTQRRNTIREFKENLGLLGLTPADLAKYFDVDERYIVDIIELRSGVLEDPWIIRNYLLRKAEERGVELKPFTALVGDHHDYWFLDGVMIDAGELQ